jgi:hypothetical protein
LGVLQERGLRNGDSVVSGIEEPPVAQPSATTPTEPTADGPQKEAATQAPARTCSMTNPTIYTEHEAFIAQLLVQGKRKEFVRRALAERFGLAAYVVKALFLHTLARLLAQFDMLAVDRYIATARHILTPVPRGCSRRRRGRVHEDLAQRLGRQNPLSQPSLESVHPAAQAHWPWLAASPGVTKRMSEAPTQMSARRRRRRTAAEVRELVAFTSNLLTAGLRKHAIKKELKQRYGCTAWVAEKYLAKARRAILDATSLEKWNRRVESARHFRDVLLNPKSSDRDRYIALERLHKLFNLPEPDPMQVVEAVLWGVPPADL